MIRLSSIAVPVLAAASVAVAQVGLEPGAAQSKQATTQRAITDFTHPAAEARGVWFASKDIFALTRDQRMAKLDQLKSAGFNRVMIDTQFRGFVLYPGSDVLPQDPRAKGEDLLKEMIDACHARGMKASAWMEFGFYAYFTENKSETSMGKLLDADPTMLSVDKGGEGKIARSFGTFYSLDPAHPHAVELIAQLNAEVAAKYDLDAINLDRVRFADFDHLSLQERARFETETGTHFADATDPKTDAGKALSDWKREQNLKACETIVTAIRKAKPALQVTAYVVPPDEKDNKSQAWDLWMKHDLLDAIAVSMYGADIDADAAKATKLLDGKTDKLIAAISSEQTTDNLTTNVERSRQLKMIGQYDWYADTIDDADVAALKAGPYSEAATDPIRAK